MSIENPPAELILAIDGGQSSTACLLGRSDGTLLSCGIGGPSAVPSGEASDALMQAALTTSVNQALGAVSPRPGGVAAAYLGLTGGMDSALRFLPELIQADRTLAESDAVAALASGMFGGPGAAVIAGTGCVAFAQNGRGERFIRGGWGYLLGDEGSGFWIGLEAIRIAIRSQDGYRPRAPLVDQVMKELQVDDMRAVQVRIYNDELSRPEIARLAPLIMRAAEAGDELAGMIIDEAAFELFSLAKAICTAAQLSEPRERAIVPAGGVLKPTTPVFARFTRLVHERLPDFQVVSPRFPAVVGAFILGLKLAGIPITPFVVDRIEATIALLPAHCVK